MVGIRKFNVSFKHLAFEVFRCLQLSNPFELLNEVILFYKKRNIFRLEVE